MNPLCRSKRLIALASAALLGCAAVLPLPAQTSGAGNITGTAGAIVPGATVVVTDTDTGISAGSPVQGCITPYAGTGTSAFGATNATNNTLYGPRQLQVSAKLFF